MNKTIVIDIETIATQREDVAAFIAENIKPPKTMSVASTIEKWHKETKPQAIQEALDSTGLDGAFGQVVCIGYQFNGMVAPCAIYGLNERELLDGFSKMMNDCVNQSEVVSTTVIGHNVSAFDLRFLMQRYMVNSIRPPFVLKRAADAKPWEAEKVFDTMVQFAGVGNRISLDKLCLALSIPSPKGDMDGSMVNQAVKDGRLLDVVEYCKRDVAATLAVFNRMTFQ